MIATHSKVNKSWKVNREVKEGQCKKYGSENNQTFQDTGLAPADECAIAPLLISGPCV